MAHERNCIICGKEYRYCPKCAQYDSMEKWHVEYCSEQCRNTYLIINKYAFKHIDKETAKMLLEGNGISKDTNLLPKWKEFADEILKEENKVAEKPKMKENSKKSATKRTARKKKNIVNED